VIGRMKHLRALGAGSILVSILMVVSGTSSGAVVPKRFVAPYAAMVSTGNPPSGNFSPLPNAYENYTNALSNTTGIWVMSQSDEWLHNSTTLIVGGWTTSILQTTGLVYLDFNVTKAATLNVTFTWVINSYHDFLTTNATYPTGKTPGGSVNSSIIFQGNIFNQSNFRGYSQTITFLKMEAHFDLINHTLSRNGGNITLKLKLHNLLLSAGGWYASALITIRDVIRITNQNDNRYFGPMTRIAVETNLTATLRSITL
jgi:hypothetical protein